MENENSAKNSDSSLEKIGFLSHKLSEDGIPNDSLDTDHIGVEIISIEPILDAFEFNCK